jgi:hypothetical protein
MAPMIMQQLPRKMLHLRPNLSFTIGTRGSERIAPKEYAAAIIPWRLPCGSPKSDHISSPARTCLNSKTHNPSSSPKAGEHLSAGNQI